MAEKFGKLYPSLKQPSSHEGTQAREQELSNLRQVLGGWRIEKNPTVPPSQDTELYRDIPADLG